MRFFNTAGPVKPDKHYCIPPLERFDLEEVLALVRDEKYFVLHAPRQTGKTSALLALRDLLNTRGYGCVYTTVETARTAREDVERVMRAVLSGMGSDARSALGDDFLAGHWSGILAEFGPDSAFREALKRWAQARWAQASAKPLVLLVDEIDTLQGAPLLSTLQQLRAGYPMRPAGFPQCVVLCGLRDVRDYRIRSTSSPFNIVAKSLRLGDFTQEETLALLDQHTGETGQAFTDEGARGDLDADPRPAIAWPQSLPPEESGGGRMREYVGECKVVRAGDGLESTVREGVEQTAGYMARCAAEAGHLVVIDRREGRGWEEKVFRRPRHSKGDVPVEVWGM